MDSYAAIYTDSKGTENLTIINDGETLRMTIRGVNFTGTGFDCLEPSNNTPKEQLAQFPLNHNELCSCLINCTIPLTVHDNGSLSSGELFVESVLGDPAQKGGLDRLGLRITLAYAQGRFAGSGHSGWFEDELIEIQSQLPSGVYMRSCINCLYSDYSPYGHGLFGSMMCFRNLKSEYLQVKSKKDFWSVYNRYDRMVQETYVCNEFEHRIPGTGYRG